MREARDRYRGTARADAVRVLAERLDAPLRIGVAGDGSAAVAALAADATAGLVDVAAPAAPHADAFVVLLRRAPGGDVVLPSRPFGSAWHRPAHAVGALLVDGPVDEVAQRVAIECAAAPDVRRLCHVVVPVAPAFAQAGLGLSDEQFRTLLARAGRGVDPAVDGVPVPVVVGAGPAGEVCGVVPVGPRAGAPSAGADGPDAERPVPLGRAVVELALAEIRSGRAPTREALAAALLQGSGLPRLRELVDERLTRRADALRSRAVLLALEDLVRHEPPPVGGDGLRYRLDRIRSGAFELTELDVVDVVRAGELDLPDGERPAVERLLGAAGSDPRSRLGLGPGTPQQEVSRAAAEQLARWRRHAANPLAGVDLRKVADVLVKTCERLLVGAEQKL